MSILALQTIPFRFSLINLGLFLQHSPLAQTIQKIAYPIFKGTTSSYLLSFGSFELTSLMARKLEVSSYVSPTSNEYLASHGILLGGSGVCGIVETLERCGIVSYGSEVAKVLFNAGTLFFLIANLVALEENIRIYEYAATSLEETLGTQRLRHSAIAGILSNLAYITASAIVLLGAPAGLALAIGVIGASSGAYKILCDFLLWKDS